MASGDSFDSLAEKQARVLFKLLAEPTWKHWLRFWERRPRDPELRKLLGRIHTAIRDVRRLEAESQNGLPHAAKERATQLLQEDLHRLSLDTALEAVDGWDQLLIEHGDERHVRDLLAAEFARDKIDTTAVTWSVGLGDKPPEETAKAVAAGQPLDTDRLLAARNQLAELYRTRSILYDLHRARLVMKSHHLKLLVPVLVVLVGVFAASIKIAGGEWRSVLLVAVAGAVGAVMSGTRKLRDDIRNINDLRAFSSSVVVQPLLGAAAGLLLLLALESEIFEVNWGGPEWARQGAIAFVAGFSEPFLLGVVSRVAGIGEERRAQEGQQRPTDRKSPSGSAEAGPVDAR
jgi:hypothetical protein